MAINDSSCLCLELKDDSSDSTLYKILSCLGWAVKIPIEFSNIDFDYFDVSRYADAPVQYTKYSNGYAGQPPPERVNPECERKIKQCGALELENLIVNLLSRGAVRDQILLTLEVLRQLIGVVDAAKQVPSLFAAFRKIRDRVFRQKPILEQISRTQQQENHLPLPQKVCFSISAKTTLMISRPQRVLANVRYVESRSGWYIVPCKTHHASPHLFSSVTILCASEKAVVISSHISIRH
ncbi:unnamed protein product [Gongylonema pulchrum]|uniref:BH4_AAA_HYDROXYL_2 domain-containing protein n=1 Tax=Gongylonema pulchrum TaxID=637853 RepID=A0A183EVZ9_9BILA|nr:unnamed protein product [Gongylonema pulchrum]